MGVGGWGLGVGSGRPEQPPAPTRARHLHPPHPPPSGRGQDLVSLVLLASSPLVELLGVVVISADSVGAGGRAGPGMRACACVRGGATLCSAAEVRPARPAHPTPPQVAPINVNTTLKARGGRGAGEGAAGLRVGGQASCVCRVCVVCVAAWWGGGGAVTGPRLPLLAPPGAAAAAARQAGRPGGALRRDGRQPLPGTVAVRAGWRGGCVGRAAGEATRACTNSYQRPLNAPPPPFPGAQVSRSEGRARAHRERGVGPGRVE